VPGRQYFSNLLILFIIQTIFYHNIQAMSSTRARSVIFVFAAYRCDVKKLASSCLSVCWNTVSNQQIPVHEVYFLPDFG